MQKNTAGKWIVYAYSTSTNLPVTGDAANITADVHIDGAAANAIAEEWKQVYNIGGWQVWEVTALVRMNGTTDYIEIAGFTQVASSTFGGANVWEPYLHISYMGTDS